MTESTKSISVDNYVNEFVDIIKTMKPNLPKLIWCPWHKTKLRSCIHRDKGLLKE